MHFRTFCILESYVLCLCSIYVSPFIILTIHTIFNDKATLILIHCFPFYACITASLIHSLLTHPFIVIMNNRNELYMNETAHHINPACEVGIMNLIGVA